MVLEERVSLNSTLDVLRDWDIALRGQLGPYASVIIDRIAEDVPTLPVHDLADGGPQP